MTLDHLHEAGVVRAALLEGVHPRPVVEDHVGQVLGRPAPPGVLLGAVALAAGRLHGIEADHGDEATVVGGPRRGAEPAFRVRLQLGPPAVQLVLETVRIGRPTLNNLNEHPAPPFRDTTDRPDTVTACSLWSRPAFDPSGRGHLA